MAKYVCSTCVNLDSPLCQLCSKAEFPSGKEAKPRYYIAMTSFMLAPKETLRDKIILCLSHSESIPLEWVQQYNRSVEPQIPHKEGE